MDYTQQARLRIDRCSALVVPTCRKLSIFWTRNTTDGSRVTFCGQHGGALANTGIEMFPLHYAPTNGKAGI